jgi:hypothetical protein
MFVLLTCIYTHTDVVNNYAETCEVDRVYDDRIMAHDYDR